MRNIDKKYIQIGIVAFLTICLCIVFYFILFNSEAFVLFGARLVNMFRPIIIGVFSAYILNPIMRVLEDRVLCPLFFKFSKDKKREPGKPPKFVRPIAVFLTISIFVVIIYTLIIMIIPQVIDSIESIITRIPGFISKINSDINKLLKDHKEVEDALAFYWKDVTDYFMTSMLPKLQDTVTSASSNIVGGVLNTVRALLDFIIGIIVAVYLLAKKEMFCAQAKKIAYAFLREERANNLINNTRFANKMFGGFLSGKIVDSIIIGILCFITISLLKIPYAVLISVIVGVTNIIPYFGPFIGAIPCAIILLMVSPIKCLTFIIFIIILQQIDGNIIGPKILGDSTGLSSFWVIFAITLFGGLWGVFGMFIGVPFFAVIYAAVRELINQRLIKKQLPSNTGFYMTYDFHTDDTTRNTGSEIKFVKKTFENISAEGKMRATGKTGNIVNSADITGNAENDGSNSISGSALGNEITGSAGPKGSGGGRKE